MVLDCYKNVIYAILNAFGFSTEKAEWCTNTQHHILKHPNQSPKARTLGVILYFADLQSKNEGLEDLPKVSEQGSCPDKFSRSKISTRPANRVNLNKQTGWRMSAKGARKT